MSQKPTDDTDETVAAPRLPYEPPAILSEEVFETLALACGKISGGGCTRSGGLSS